MMKTFCSFLLFLMMTYAIVGMIFPTAKADEMTISSINEFQPDQIEIIVDVWPKNILSGDCVYVLYYVKNKSQDVFAIQPIDFFDNVVPVGRGYRNTGYPYYFIAGDGGWGEYQRYARSIELGVIKVPSGETYLAFTDIYVIPNRIAKPIYTDDGGHIMRELVEEPTELTVANFADKYAPSVQQPWPILHVTKRPEWRLVSDFYGTTSEFHVFWQKGKVNTASGNFTVQQFFPVKELDIRQHDSLPDISAWKAFEEKLSPGTFRDEIRLGRIQVQYLDGQEEEALDELREWFAKMEPIQSTVLAASLCLPEGLEKVSEKDMKFMFIIELVASADKETYMEARREAHKHYMAMRRAFDKVVRPYNTLPKRKLREKSEFE